MRPTSLSAKPRSVGRGFFGRAGHVRVRVLKAMVPIGQIAFAIRVEENPLALPQRPVDGDAHKFTRAFLSYSHKDAVEVFKRAQALRLAKIGIFQDLLSTEPGEEWSGRLYSEIDRCDLFLLFWSEAARRSPWVAREVERALAAQEKSQHGAPVIVPVILEGPPPPQPPDNLRHLHFNDPICYFIAAQRLADIAGGASQ